MSKVPSQTRHPLLGSLISAANLPQGLCLTPLNLALALGLSVFTPALCGLSGWVLLFLLPWEPWEKLEVAALSGMGMDP